MASGVATLSVIIAAVLEWQSRRWTYPWDTILQEVVFHTRLPSGLTRSTILQIVYPLQDPIRICKSNSCTPYSLFKSLCKVTSWKGSSTKPRWCCSQANERLSTARESTWGSFACRLTSCRGLNSKCIFLVTQKSLLQFSEFCPWTCLELFEY